ncbi:Glycosyltransferase WbsX [Mucilaginibacter pineti]|uniref:Glycosyltransferase WbsX n=2 Tax=Mucilaginibacter pineti TaxID=1391627 RepID=A0A1G7E3Q6_9SPHI|nr:Glycosyltransferase WbsX [Mucilaginibacter pineti]
MEVNKKKQKFVKYLFTTLAFITCIMAAHAQPAEQQYDVAAYVWPAYQPDARFKDIGVFKDGKGEWEAIYNAKPKFPGHNQPHVPLWGYTNEADPKVMEKKIDAATSHGVNVFIYDWYWYDGKPWLENGVDKGFLGAKNNNKMKFYLMWANHDHSSYLDYTTDDKSKIYWHGGVDRPTFDKMVAHIIKDYFSKPNYYKINGEPVFSIYELSTFINGLGSIDAAKEALAYFTQKTKEAGFPGLHLQGVLWGAIPSGLSATPGDKTSTQNNVVLNLGLKSLTNYQWCHYVPMDRYDRWGDKAIEGWAKFNKDFTVPFFPHVSISWDPNPRYPGALQGMVTEANPKDFKRFLLQAKAYADAHPDQPKLITINAWNEWAEGSYLEPDKQHGYDYLDAVKEVFGKK